MKKALLTLLLSLCIVTPAFAMTREEILAEITRLTAIADILAAQIRALGVQPSTTVGVGQGGTTSTSGSGGAATPTGTPRFDPSSICVRITKNLAQGQSSNEVVALQDMLASVGVFANSSTGYFGPATAAAVRQFQSVNGLSAIGTVGPATAQALFQACTGGSTYAPASGGTGGTSAVAPVDRSSLSVTPLSGKAPLLTIALFAINGTTCSSYSLDWGDGTPRVSRSGATTDCATDNINRQLSHTYAAPGSYTITLRTIRGSINAAPVVAQQVVSVQ